MNRKSLRQEGQAHEPWKQWPRSPDVRLWMLALLRLTDHMKSAKELESSIVVCAIGELARMGYFDEALEQIERVHRLLPSSAASERSRILMQGAEIALDMGKLQQMEDYLHRVIELEPLFTRKCDKGWTAKYVRQFRIRHGLLASRDVIDENERVDVSFNGLIQAAAQAIDQGDAATSVCKLVEAQRFLASMPGWKKHQAIDVLVIGLSKAKDEKHLRHLLKIDATADRTTRLSPRTLLTIGQRARAIARYADEAGEALATLNSRA